LAGIKKNYHLSLKKKKKKLADEAAGKEIEEEERWEAAQWPKPDPAKRPLFEEEGGPRRERQGGSGRILKGMSGFTDVEERLGDPRGGPNPRAMLNEKILRRCREKERGEELLGRPVRRGGGGEKDIAARGFQ